MPHYYPDSDQHPDSQVRVTPIRRCVSPGSQRRDKGTDFILTGFHQIHGIRYYVYQGQPDDGSSTEFTVDADVRLLRKYGIALQELPLLCRRLLEKQNPVASRNTVTFTEDLMKEQADARAALQRAAQAKKKIYRRVRVDHLERDPR